VAFFSASERPVAPARQEIPEGQKQHNISGNHATNRLLSRDVS
jgi:hypothetical protein